MALRLRRGTNTERQTATFSEGELIYVTDYESAGVSPLWIGDGSTVGGNEVETGGTPTLALNDLTDVNAVAIENNVLVYKGSQWTAVDPTTLGISGSGIVEGQEYNISINGSVIGSDSSIIVDHITQVVTANLFVGSGAGLTDINLVDLDDVFAFGAVENDVLTYNGTGWVPAPGQGIQLGQTYDINIEGNVIGSDSSVIVNAFTNAGEFDNLITKNLTLNSELSTKNITVNSVTGGFSAPGILYNVSRTSTISPQALQAEDVLVDIFGRSYDGANFVNSASIRIGVDKDVSVGSGVAPGRVIFLTFDETGATGVNNAMVFTHQGRLGIANELPSEKLDVNGNGVFSGDVTAAAFKGSLVGDDSTILVDAINNTIPGYVSIATLKSIAASSATYGDFQSAIAAL